MVWDLGFLQIPIVKFHTVDGQNPCTTKDDDYPIIYQRKFGWETSELRTFKNAKNSVK